MNFAKYITPVLAIFLCLGFSLSALAGVPDTMTYDGSLTDSDGKLVNTTVEVSFHVFDAETAGTQTWSEPVSTIKVVNGHFTHQLGAKTSLKNVFDGKTYWLEVSIDGSALSPRTAITSIPYAFRANTADSADTLQGKTSEQIIALAKTGGAATAKDIIYDNKTSGMKATDIQAALDELAQYRANEDLSVLLARVIALETLTANMKLQEINGKLGMTFTGVNVHVRSGSGATSGVINGLGNLIVGYDEGAIGAKTGSHNLVVGSDHTYTNHGGFVAGLTNTISGPYASVSGGISNTASSMHASVSGGSSNTASGDYASVSGGTSNTAKGQYASVSAGSSNTANNNYSSISGGTSNTTNGDYSSISGGTLNVATGNYSSINGGQKNTVPGVYASVLGD